MLKPEKAEHFWQAVHTVNRPTYFNSDMRDRPRTFNTLWPSQIALEADHNETDWVRLQSSPVCVCVCEATQCNLNVIGTIQIFSHVAQSPHHPSPVL